MTDGTQESTLDSALVARVLRRAGELALAAPADRDQNGIGEASVIAAANEVGLPIESVKRSLAVERLGPPPAVRWSDRLFGVSVVVVEEEITGSVAEVLDRLDVWMVGGHHLRREHGRADVSGGHAEWGKRSGIGGVAARTIRRATGEGQLGDLRRITAVATDTGLGSCAVRVSADRGNDRQLFVGGGAALAATGTTGIVVVATLVASPLVLLASPVAILAGAGVAARGRVRARRTEHEIVRLLDTVDQGIGPTRLGADVARRVAGRTRR
ncbi:MAG: hypothetical protein ABIR32_02310 [Ilumatobacteraceae bacterium]